MTKKKIETNIVHEERVDVDKEAPVSPPIYQTINFSFPTAEFLGNTISGGSDNEIFVYTRGSNPTQRTLEKTVAKLEGSEDAICTSSGMAAITLTALTFLKKGDHAIVGSVTYGDTCSVFGEVMSKFGVETTFVDTTDIEKVKSALKDNTKIILFETPTNPTLRITDIQAIADLVKNRDIRIVVDNTVMSPYFQKPIKHGAHISIESCSKYLGGHSDVVAGVVACSREDWVKLRRIVFSTGPVLDPHAAWLVLRGIKTLHVRLKKHHENVLEIVKFLLEHPKITKVNHPAVPEHPDKAVAEKQMTGMPSIVSFEIEGGLENAQNFINRLKLFKRTVSIGCVESFAEHPASMTHAVMPREQRLAHGVTDNLVRLSIGIENSEDLIDDLKQALD